MNSGNGNGRRWDGVDRRSGGDRRQVEGVSPTGRERRRRAEPRQMQVVELFLSPEQWQVVKRHWRSVPDEPVIDGDDDAFGEPGFVQP